jgi:site-specific recombinase XerD
MENKIRKLYHNYREDFKLRGKNTAGLRGLERFIEYAESREIDLSAMKEKDAADFQVYLSGRRTAKGKSYSRAYIQNIVSNSSSFYEFLKRKKLAYVNPFADLRRTKKEKALPRNLLTEEEMDKFLRHLRNFTRGKDVTERKLFYKAHVVSELMYSTGARVNEIAKLREKDIDLSRGVAVIEDSKSGKVREVVLNSYTEKILKIFLELRPLLFKGMGSWSMDKELLFGSRKSLQIWLNRVLNSESKKLGFGRFTSHCFRHAVGYHLLRGGCDIRFIQEILGHKKLYSTQIYTRVDKGDLKGVLDSFHPRSSVKRNVQF